MNPSPDSTPPTAADIACAAAVIALRKINASDYRGPRAEEIIAAHVAAEVAKATAELRSRIADDNLEIETLKSACAEREANEKELAKDEEIVDWIEKHPNNLHYYHHHGREWEFQIDILGCPLFGTLREAVRWAIANGENRWRLTP